MYVVNCDLLLLVFIAVTFDYQLCTVLLCSDFIPPSGKGASISVSTVVGIVVAAVSVAVLVLGILWWKGCLRRKNRTDLGIRISSVSSFKFNVHHAQFQLY